MRTFAKKLTINYPNETMSSLPLTAHYAPLRHSPLALPLYVSRWRNIQEAMGSVTRAIAAMPVCTIAAIFANVSPAVSLKRRSFARRMKLA